MVLIEHIKMLNLDYIRMNIMTANYIPTTTIVDYLMSDLSRGIIISNLVGNLVLFIPFGMLVFLSTNKSIKHAVGIGFITSLVIELLQLFLLLGSFDIDDILLNSMGTLKGVAVVRYWNKNQRSHSKEGHNIT